MTDNQPGGGGEDFQFQTRVVQDGYAYWVSKCSEGGLPARQDINPVEIPRLMPHVVMLDVKHEPEFDFRYRLLGTYVTEHLYSDHSGKWFSEITHQRAPSKIWQNCCQVATSRSPFMSNTPYVGPHQSFRDVEDIILPLSSDGERVDSLLVFVCYHPRSDT